LAATVASAALLFSAPQIAADPETQLESAIHREVVVGDIASAMEQYRAILSAPEKSRGVAARALFQIGQCLEKSGQRKEARATYLKVLAEYADQPEVVTRARGQLAAWDEPLPGPLNLRFEQGTPGKVPPGWFVPALPKDADRIAELRRSGCKSQGGCAVVVAPPNAPSPFGNLMQSFSAAAYRGKTVRLRASLRVEAAGTDDHAQMWFSVDRSRGRRGFFDDMGDRPVRAQEWTRCEITGPVDGDATFINFGVMSNGRGRVWVDEVSFEVISK
jgi:hypothetical protein